MFKRYLSTVLVGLLVFGGNTSYIFAQTNNNAEKIKAAVVKRGTSEKKPVRVKMLNGTKMKGYISQIGEDSFTLTFTKNKQQTVIPYSDVAWVEGRGLAGGARVGIIVAAAVGAGLLVLYIAFQNAIRDN
jgi:sRNA-binding regulator protein Hfq